ncbi:hypothetical protein M3Y97_00195000 [Aphelenchoides bicaudatus]|nr:hypothetical protein M3Y97_00195000 [Aphelenchoides bicaudatus]
MSNIIDQIASNSFTTGYCLTTEDLNDIDRLSPFSIGLLILSIMDFIALILTVYFVSMESLEKRAYRKEKTKPVKLLLTKDRLGELRPKDNAPAPSIVKSKVPSLMDADLKSKIP